MELNYKYLDNAFWEAEDRSIVKCIKITEKQNGQHQKEILTFRKFLGDKTLCPNYKEVVASVGLEKIDRNTADRHARKSNEEKEKRAIHEQQKRTAELEMLFNMKLQAFEVDEIKNCEDRKLRTRLRRAKNAIELNAIASLIIGKELGLFENESESD